MEYKKYKTSELYISKQKRIMFILQLIMPLFLAAMFLINYNVSDNFSTLLIAFVIAIVIIELILFIQPRIMFSKMRNNEILINEVEIIRQNINVKETVKISDISKIKVSVDKNSNIRIVRIYFNKTNIIIHGIENINDFFLKLENLLKVNNTEIVKKKIKIDFQNPLYLAIYLCLVSTVVILLMKYAEVFYENFQLFVPVVVGIFFLIFRPLSKSSGKKFAKLEVVLGIILVVVGILNILMNFI